MARRINGIYNVDSTARKINVQEKEDQRRYERMERKSRREEEKAKQAVGKINSGIDIVSAVVLSLALVCVVVFGLQYLVKSSEITSLEKQVSSLSKSLVQIQNENEGAYAAVDSSVDIGHVYDVAVSELGMVYPDDTQIVLYDFHEEGYVRQYSEVPEY